MAIKLLWAGLVFELAASAASLYIAPARDADIVGAVFGGAVNYLATTWLIRGVTRGRDWARLLVGIFGIACIWNAILGLAKVFGFGLSQPGVAWLAIGCAALILGVAIVTAYTVYLLFAQPGDAWFNAMTDRK
ncbi:MAG TPA: hypothetical protein VH105_11795 [Burkholderiales bacterium]|nr:hypothetical protein [Burkholderiales bacterium]